jgi:hypothetical protein
MLCLFTVALATQSKFSEPRIEMFGWTMNPMLSELLTSANMGIRVFDDLGSSLSSAVLGVVLPGVLLVCANKPLQLTTNKTCTRKHLRCEYLKHDRHVGSEKALLHNRYETQLAGLVLHVDQSQKRYLLSMHRYKNIELMHKTSILRVYSTEDS